MEWARNSGEFHLGDFPVQSGGVIRDARLVWKTHGTLAPGRDNVVLYPCSYSAKHTDIEWLVGPEGIRCPYAWRCSCTDRARRCRGRAPVCRGSSTPAGHRG